jgi:hypothetical protein
MKKVLLIIGAIIGGVAVVASIIVGIVFYSTRPIVQTADAFFALARDNKFDEAYTMTSIGFKEVTNLAEFKAFLQRSQIDQYESAFWNQRSIDTDLGGITTGILGGTIKTKNQKNIPLTMDFIQENKDWKIHHIKLSNGFPDGDQKSVPGDQEIKKLVHETMVDFNEAIKAGNFETFYAHISEFWKAQTTASELQAIFQKFIDKKFDLSFVKQIEPIIEEKPIIDEHGALQIKGHYPLDTLNGYFELGYLYEDPQWKLVNIKVNFE